jgi:Carboxypeptidase regulatory-like domain
MHLWYLTLFCLLVVAEPQGPIPQPATTPAGAIIGTVTDESGKPVVGARVQAVGRKKKWAGGYYEIPTGPPDDSDDRGQFRLHSLPPGQYVVAVFLPSQPPATDYREANEYVRTYNLDLIRFGGHLPKGGYDVRNGRHTKPARAPAIHG